MTKPTTAPKRAKAAEDHKPGQVITRSLASCPAYGERELTRAQALPELGEGEPDVPEFEPGAIERFKDADGRTMRVVRVGADYFKAAA